MMKDNAQLLEEVQNVLRSMKNTPPFGSNIMHAWSAWMDVMDALEEIVESNKKDNSQAK